jgi:hypothetical protein
MKYPIAKMPHFTAQNIFLPISSGKRQKAVTYSFKNQNTLIEVSMFEQLDIYDEDLLTTILSFANPIDTGKRATVEQEIGLENTVMKMDNGYIEKKLGSINIIKSKYEIIKEMKGRDPVESDYMALEKSLKRLFKTSI